MKNSQKGSITTVVLIAVIALLVIGGGVYVYKNNKTEAPAVVDTGTQQNTTQKPPLANSSEPCTRNGSMGTYKCEFPVLKVNGPQSLDLNQPGTWTVDAYSPNDKGEGSTLTYSVKWGDTPIVPKFGTEYPPFTHAYSQFGTYTLLFTAKDSTGLQTTASTSVSVINSTSPGLNATSNWKTYTNTQYGFSIQYPSNLVDRSLEALSYYDHVVNPNFSVVKRLGMPGSTNSGSQSIDGLIQISVATQSGVVSTCLTVRSPDELNNTFNVANVMINGSQFAEFDSSSGDLSNRFGERVFSTVKNNACYRIEIIESGVAFTAGPKVSQQTATDEATRYGFPFSAYDVFDKLTPVAMTFRFN